MFSDCFSLSTVSSLNESYRVLDTFQEVSAFNCLDVHVSNHLMMVFLDYVVDPFRKLLSPETKRKTKATLVSYENA